MAYVVSTLVTTSEAASASIVPELPAHQTNDLLLVLCTNDGGGTAFSTASSGWTAVDAGAASDGQRSGFVWKVAASGSETAPTIACANDDWIATVLVIRDVDTASPIHGSAISAVTAATTLASAALTTTVDNCLLIYGWGIDCAANGRGFVMPEDLVFRSKDLPLSSITVSQLVGSRPQYTAGAAPTVNLKHDESQGGHAITIAVKNATGGSASQAPSGGITPVYRFTSGDTPTFAAANSEASLTAINGINMGASTSSVSAGAQADAPWGTCAALSDTLNTAGAWVGGICALTGATDFTAGPFSIMAGSSTISPARFGAEGLVIVLMDASGYWKAFQLCKRSAMASAKMYTFVIDAASATAYGSGGGGSVNLAAITKVGLFHHRQGSSATAGSFSVRNLRIHPVAKLLGGGPNNPINTSHLTNAVCGWNSFGVDLLQGAGQTLSKHSIQIGDGGTTPTYFDAKATSYELPLPYSAAARRILWNVGEEKANVTIYAGASDTINFGGSILATTSKQLLTIHASSSTSASYDFTGASIVGWDITWKTGVDCHGANFSSCYEIDCKAATFDGCSFQKQVENYACVLEDGAEITDCAFTAVSSGQYAIRITAAGTYTLDGTTFSGYTTPIKVTAVSGTVTIHLALGQTEPDVSSDGATVVFDQPLVSATGSVTGMIAGGRLYVYNDTTNTEMVNAIQAGTSYTVNYDNGTGYTNGDEILLRWRKAGYESIELRATATTGGWSFTLTPETDIHTTLTTPANVTVDYANQKIRATSTRDTFTAQQVVDIIVAAETTEDGIRLPKFAEVGGLVELTSGVFTALTVELDDWQLSWAAGSVSQAFVTGGNIVGGVLGDPVEDVVGGPQVTVMLAQAGTVVAVGSGVTSQDKTDIIDGVWAKVLP